MDIYMVSSLTKDTYIGCWVFKGLWLTPIQHSYHLYKVTWWEQPEPWVTQGTSPYEPVTTSNTQICPIVMNHQGRGSAIVMVPSPEPGCTYDISRTSCQGPGFMCVAKKRWNWVAGMRMKAARLPGWQLWEVRCHQSGTGACLGAPME